MSEAHPESIQTFFRTRRCLLTGHTGFKGSWLALLLHHLGADIHGFSLAPETQPNLFEAADIAPLLHHHEGDITQRDVVQKLVDTVQPEIVFHLAAQPIVRTSYRIPRETFEINTLGTLNLLESLRHSDHVRAIVVVTTDKVYRDCESTKACREQDPLGGHDPYSASKAAAEIICHCYQKSFFQERGIQLATARAGNIIGGGDWAKDRLIPDAVQAIQSGKAIPVRNPDSTRPWQHVLDPLAGYLQLASHLLHTNEENQHAAWNFGPAQNDHHTVEELISTFLKTYGTGSWNDLSERQKKAPHESNWLGLDCSKARDQLAWSPRFTFQQAVAHTSSWYKQFYDGDAAQALCQEQIQLFLNT